ncbi:MAG: hypothetical protein R3F44_17210 [Candidatus Competibacteraceae bacterium]
MCLTSGCEESSGGRASRQIASGGGTDHDMKAGTGPQLLRAAGVALALFARPCLGSANVGETARTRRWPGWKPTTAASMVLEHIDFTHKVGQSKLPDKKLRAN